MVADQYDEVFVASRRQLRGVAEALIAGPQYRAAGTIRLAVRPDGFTGVALPIAVHGSELTWPNGGMQLAGPVDVIAAAAGIEAGPPSGVYDIVDPLPSDAVLDIDGTAAEWIYRSLYAGGYAIKHVLPDEHPVLWPEHFDVAATENEVNYGISAGDDFHHTPYVYVGPWDAAVAERSGPFWNAPFGAVLGLDPADDVDQLSGRIIEFFERGREELAQRT
jgi:hypothetical protein